jgi:hypothetical protein
MHRPSFIGGPFFSQEIKMKKILVTAIAMMIVSAPSFASTARLLALGMNEIDNDGMYIVQDSRNIFLNPAYANIYYNLATLEFGNHGLYVGTDSTGAASTAATVWKASTPKAQGGFFKKYGDFVYGVYLGNESNTSSFLRLAATSTASALNNFTSNKHAKMLQTADNQIDLFLAGENTFKWGASLIFAQGKDETRSSTDQSIAGRYGLMGANWEAAVSASFASNSKATEAITPLAGITTTVDETVTQEFKGKSGFQLGGAYSIFKDTKVFGYVKNFGWEQSDSYSKYTTLRTTANGLSAVVKGTVGTSGQLGTIKGDFTCYYLGIGNEHAVGNSDKIYSTLSLKKTDINLKFTSATQIRHVIVPLVIGYETKANDWLTLRGSFVQNIYGAKDNSNEANVNVVAKTLISQTYGADGKSTIANSSAVNAGATLTFGQLAIDGVIGTTGIGGAAASNTGVLSASNLQTTLAMTYKF